MGLFDHFRKKDTNEEIRGKLIIENNNSINSVELSGQETLNLLESRLAGEKGVDYEKTGQWSLAIEQHKKAIALFPKKNIPHLSITDLSIHHTNLGVCYGKVGKIENAIQELENALKINPNYERARNNLEKCKFIKESNKAQITNFKTIDKSEQEFRVITPFDAIEAVRKATNNKVKIIGIGIPSKSDWEKVSITQQVARKIEHINNSHSLYRPKQNVLNKIEDIGNPELKEGFEKYLTEIQKFKSVEFLFHPRTLVILKNNKSLISISARNSEYVLVFYDIIHQNKLEKIKVVLPEATYSNNTLKLVVQNVEQIDYLINEVLPHQF